MKFKISQPTWLYEAFVVGLLLFVILCFKGFQKEEIICSLAVFFTFLHAQVADRMQEKQSKMAKPDVECFKWSNRYFVIKETLWIAFFMLIGSYAALTGAVIFSLYPLWRLFYRKLSSKNKI